MALTRAGFYRQLSDAGCRQFVRMLSDSPIEVEYALGQRLAGLLTYASSNLSSLPRTFSSGLIELSSQRLQLRGSGGL